VVTPSRHIVILLHAVESRLIAQVVLIAAVACYVSFAQITCAF